MKISGIYKIVSRSNPRKIYIGSAVNIMYRWRCHISNLKSHKHPNNKLQNHFNKYGELDLQFSVLIGCNKEDLITNEQFFIDSYNPYFNIRQKAESNLGIKGHVAWNKGKPWSKEMKDKLSKAHEKQIPWNIGRKGLYTLSEETKLKMKQNSGMKGKPSPKKGIALSDETKLRMKAGQKERRLREMNIILN